jgi:beta-lactamase class A
MIFYRRILLIRILLLLLLTATLTQVPAQTRDSLFTDSVKSIALAARGHVGVDIMDAESNQGYSLNAHDHFPMLSVFKFPLALYVLDQVDKGRLSPDQRLTIRKSEWTNTYSPLLDQHEENTFQLTMRDLLAGAVSLSDNVACDLLFRLIGGPPPVNLYIHGLGVREINIAATEKEMATDPQNMYRNWCTPADMDVLLQMFYEGHVLSPESTALLKQWMTETPTGPRRIKGLLPKGTVVAHKTGTSDTDSNGLTIATNDAGVMSLPNGHHLYVVVFISDSHADEAMREGVIARISRLAYNSFSK